jgi:F-type H+-transporting ATPase subunit delta
VRTPAAVVRPYARALHDLAKEREQTDTVATELRAFVETLAQELGLRELFVRPWVPANAKGAVAAEVATRLGLSPLTRDFLALVARQGRADHVEDIEVAFRDLVDADLGRVRARVRTVVAMTDLDKQALRQRLGRALGGRQVVLEETVDRGLLGGFIAEVDSFIVDGSLDGQLARLRERLVKGQGDAE